MFDDVPFAALEVVGDLSDRPQIYGKRDASRSVAGDRGGKLFKINFQLGIRVHFFGLLQWVVCALVGVYLALERIVRTSDLCTQKQSPSCFALPSGKSAHCKCSHSPRIESNQNHGQSLAGSRHSICTNVGFFFAIALTRQSTRTRRRRAGYFCVRGLPFPSRLAAFGQRLQPRQHALVEAFVV